MMAGLEAKTEEARAQAEKALVGIRQSIVALLVARGIPCSEGFPHQVFACEDTETLQRWLLRATTARTTGEVFEG